MCLFPRITGKTVEKTDERPRQWLEEKLYADMDIFVLIFFCHITRDWYISSEHLRALDLRLRSDDQCRKKTNCDGPGLRSDHCRSGFPKSFCFSNGQPAITNPFTWGFHRCARSRRAHCIWDAFTWHCPACDFFKIKHVQCIQCKGFPSTSGLDGGLLHPLLKLAGIQTFFGIRIPQIVKFPTGSDWLISVEHQKKNPLIEVHPRCSCIAWFFFWNRIFFWRIPGFVGTICNPPNLHQMFS